MKGRNWRKSLAACMALAIVACSTPQQSASELVNGLTFTAKALEEPTTNSETIENSSPVDEETQKSEMQPVEETPSENEATNEETPENPDEDTAPKLLYGKVMSKMPLAAASATNGLSYISRSWDASSKQVVETQATYTGQYIKLSDQA